VQNLAKRTCIPQIVVWQRLTNYIGFIVKYLYLVLYKMNNIQLPTKAQMSNELLRIVRSIEYQGWQYFITLDELWFYLSTDCEII
jgi:hypothetical protein